MRATVAVVRTHNHGTGFQQLQHQRDRRHSGAGDNGRCPALSLSQRFRQQRAGGITASGVIVLAFLSESGK